MLKVTYITSLLPPSINGPNCDRHTWGVVQTVTLIFPKAFIFLVPSQRSISLYSCPVLCVRPILLFYISFLLAVGALIMFPWHFVSMPLSCPTTPRNLVWFLSVCYQRSNGWLQEPLISYSISSQWAIGRLPSREFSSTCQHLQSLLYLLAYINPHHQHLIPLPVTHEVHPNECTLPFKIFEANMRLRTSRAWSKEMHHYTISFCLYLTA